MSNTDPGRRAIDPALLNLGDALTAIMPHVNEMPPHLRRAFDGEAALLFHLGRPEDTAPVVSSIARAHLRIQEGIESSLSALGDGQFSDAALVTPAYRQLMSAEPMATPRRLREALDKGWNSGDVWSQGIFAGHLAAAQAAREAGLGVSPTLHILFVALAVQCVSTRPDAIAAEDYIQTDSAQYQAALNSLNSRDEPLILNPNDLDERVRVFLAYAQLELISDFLDSTLTLSKMGRRGRDLARKLIARHRPALFDDNLNNKLAMNHELANCYMDVSTAHAKPSVRRGVAVFADSVRTLPNALDDVFAFFRMVYARLDYDLPAELRLPEHVIAKTAGATATVRSIRPEPEVRVEELEPPDPEIAAAITDGADALAADAAQLRPRWTLTAGQKKEQYRHLLVQLRGRLGGISSEHAVAALDNMRRLLGDAAALPVFKDTAAALARDIASERDLQHRADGLRLRAAGNRMTIELAAIPPVHQTLLLLARDEQLRADIIAHLVPDQAAQTALLDNLHYLLTAWEWLPRDQG